jgi:hypothetical protein
LIALFFYFGKIARKPSSKAFAVGFVIYAIDALLFLFVGAFIGLALHALGLYFLWTGWQTARKMRKGFTQGA